MRAGPIELSDHVLKRARVSAAIALLDRGWGRPKQELGIEMKSDEAVAKLLEQARRRANVLPASEAIVEAKHRPTNLEIVAAAQ